MKVDPLIKITAQRGGEVRCIVFTPSMTECRSSLADYNVRILREFPFISAFGVELNVASLDELSQLESVRFIGSTLRVFCHTHIAREVTGVDAFHAEGVRGKGVTIAVVDTGATPHLDFCMPRNRLRFIDLVYGKKDPYDDNGHGTFVAGVAAGNGLVSGGRFMGMSPESDIIAVKVMDEGGEGTVFQILEGMQWVYANADRYNIRVCCMSFGSEITQKDPLIRGAESLWRRGITVVASAGNSGPEAASIKSPGASPIIITAGALNDGRGLNAFDIPAFSSKGPIMGYHKPDIVAPAVDINSCSVNGFYTTMSGTSVAAPVTAGIAALLISANPSLTPSQVKSELIKRAKDLGKPRNEQGHGCIHL